MSDLFDETNIIYDEAIPLGMKGVLWKWTNYINGWQKRYFILRQGVLSYFKSEEEKKFGCRGAISLKSSKIVPNDFDRLRFDVVTKDCVWYLKAEPSDIDKWISALTDPKAESGYESETSFPHCRSKSFTSGELSERTTDSHCIGRVLKKKLNEIETLEDILFHQVATLQAYFDACANSVTREFEPYSKEFESLNEDLDKENSDYGPEGSEGDMRFYRKEHGAMAIDFKGEAISFKSTALGLLNNLRHCVEIIMQKETNEKWRQNNQCASDITGQNDPPVPFPQVTHNFKDEEFFDAMDSANACAENSNVKNNATDLKGLNANRELSCSSGNHSSFMEEESNTFDIKALNTNCELSGSSDNRSSFTEEMDIAVNKHILTDRLALSDFWQCIHQEGSMFVYRKEVVENGTILDPLKMVHSVEGITGYELCWYFWNPQYRMDWETTLESSKVIEQIDNKTIISYQVHKRVWPTAQRDSCLLSRLDSVEENKDFPTWIVVNRTVDHPEAPIVSPRIRILVDVALTCETKLKPNADINNLTRDDIICDLTYVASVHPGGWAPIAAVRAVAKREFPRFLSHFTKFVIDSTKDTSIRFN